MTRLRRLGELALALTLLGGCYLSHGSPGGAPDAGQPDGGSVEADAGADAGSDEASAVLDVYRLFGVRDEGRMKLVVGRDLGLRRPIEVFEVSPVGPTLELSYAIPDTAGAEPAAVASFANVIALALSHGGGERQPELVLFDGDRGEVLARAVFDEGLPSTHVVHATMVMNREQLLVLSHRADGGTLARVLSLADLSPVWEGEGTSIGLDAAARLGLAEPAVGRVVAAALGPEGVEHAAALAYVSVDADERSVAGLARGLWIDGVPRASAEGEIPAWSNLYGSVDYAFGAHSVLALSTDTGLHWAVVPPEGPVTFRTAESRFLGVYPVAYALGGHAGVFYIDPALGSARSELRYVGVRP